MSEGEAGSGEEMGQPTKTPAAAVRRKLGEPLPLQWADYFTVMGHHMVTQNRGSRTRFDAGRIDLWMGGPIDRHWSGLVNPTADIEEGGLDVEQAYVHYDSHWNERFVSARVGQIMPFAILFNQGGPGMSLSAPVVLTTAADTGTTWTPTTLMRGAEIGAVNLPRWNVYAGVVQPNREGSQTTDPHTDAYASAEYLIGKRGDSLTAYGYWGKATGLDAHDRGFHRIGLFANAYAKSTKATAGYLTGSDDSVGRSLDNWGYFVQAEQLLSEQWAAYVRYDRFRQDLAAGGARSIDGPSVGVSWWAQSQIRLTLEGRVLETSGERNNRMLMAEFMWVF
ncbi:MAG: hypothetical protein WBX15_19545 [Thermoanaerobaculia bacterium]